MGQDRLASTKGVAQSFWFDVVVVGIKNKAEKKKAPAESNGRTCLSYDNMFQVDCGFTSASGNIKSRIRMLSFPCSNYPALVEDLQQ